MYLEKLTEKEREFLDFKKIEGLKDISINSYYKVFLNFKDVIGELDISNFNSLCQKVLEYFKYVSVNNGNTTFNNKRKHLNGYFNYLVDRELLQDNPIHFLKIKKKKENYDPKPTNADDIKSFFYVINLKTYVGFRDYAFMLLLTDAGIRPTEATRLKIQNVDLKNLFIHLTPDITKTSRSRSLPFSSIVRDVLKKLLEFNKEFWDSDYIFLTECGNTTNTIVFQRRFKVYSNKCNCKITPYQLRHYFGTSYLQNSNGNLLYLQKLMGHSDLKMTKKYVKIDENMLKNNHKIATPLNNIITRNTKVRRLFK